MILCYSAIDRTSIFASDTSYVKYADNEKRVYEYSKYEEYGYLSFDNFYNYLAAKGKEKYGEDYADNEEYIALADQARQDLANGTYATNEYAKDFIDSYTARGWEITFLPQIVRSGKVSSRAYLIATYERNVFARLGDYFGSMFSFETTSDVDDPNLPEEERYIRWEWDERSNMPALVGNGTTHKYLLYFDSKFPFVHVNFFQFKLGTSYVMYKGSNVSEVITTHTGATYQSEQEYPSQLGTGITHLTSYDFHTVTYNKSELSDIEKEMYNDHYTVALQQKDGLSMLANSFIIGLIATLIAYLLGLPFGIRMAHKKDGLGDKIGNLYIIFIMATPSLAYIFIFAAIGTSLFNLPYKFALAEVPILAYILPTVSLALPSIGSLMKWTRRYMIDQMNSDYVKFARSQGLSEGEIFTNHIFPNAFIYLVHGLPGNILACLTGAIITERVYGVPGVGNLLTNGINKYDNGLIVACTAFYTVLSIISVIAGDLLLAKYDPRVSLSGGKA